MTDKFLRRIPLSTSGTLVINPAPPTIINSAGSWRAGQPFYQPFFSESLIFHWEKSNSEELVCWPAYRSAKSGVFSQAGGLNEMKADGAS